MANSATTMNGHVSWELTDENGLIKAQGEAKNRITDIGDQYYASRASNIVGTAQTITAIATGTTAVVTTSAAHGFGVGDVVTIAGVTPAGYNGKWAITAVGSATTFSIYVGTALGAGTAFGTATGMLLGPAVGMKLGTGSTAVSKNGAGAALTTYLANSQQAFDSTYPSQVENAGAGDVITYKVTYAAGKATSASTPITECVIFNDYIADATSPAGATIARILLTGIASKQSTDTLTITWTHTLLGS